MRSLASVVVVLLALAGAAFALEPGSPEDALMRYLRALKDGDSAAAYDLTSKALRGGKDKEVWIKEQKALMGMADVKIFDFTVFPGKVTGDKAQVPNILESQDKYVNTLGLTEHELYTLVREDGGWKVDSQILLEQAEIPKWFPSRKKDDAKPAPSH
jgi:hypothetical protein